MNGSRDIRGQPPAIVWFRQELRLADNPALRIAAQAGPVLPVYVFGRRSGRRLGHGRRAPLVAARQPRIARARPAEGGVHASSCAGARRRRSFPGSRRRQARWPCMPGSWSSHGRARRTRRSRPRCPRACRCTATARACSTTRTRCGPRRAAAYGIYTPFARATRALGPPDRPKPAPKTLTGVPAHSDTLADWQLRPSKPDWAAGLRETWRPGEAAAHARAKWFLDERLAGYEAGRNTPART